MYIQGGGGWGSSFLGMLVFGGKLCIFLTKKKSQIVGKLASSSGKTFFPVLCMIGLHCNTAVQVLKMYIPNQQQQYNNGKLRTVLFTGAETAKLRLKWKSKKQDETNGGYSYDYLMQVFSKVSS